MLKSKKYDLIIVGAGITGTFCALHALNKKKSVLLIEKDNSPFESSFRNLGHINPSGQSFAKWFDISRKSLRIYQGLQENFDLTFSKTGTWYIAKSTQELTLLHELQALFEERNYPAQLYSPADCKQLNPALITNKIFGGIHLPNEGVVDSKEMTHRLRNHLISELGLHYKPNTLVVDVEKRRGIAKIVTSQQETIWADHIILACGNQTQLLLPNHYPTELLQKCQSQIIKLSPQRTQLKNTLISGASVECFSSSQSCPSFDNSLPQDEIKLTIKQLKDGSVLLGETVRSTSIQKQSDLGFELSMEANNRLIEKAKTFIDLPAWDIESTWTNTYLEHVGDGVFSKTVDDIIHILAGMGNKSITTSPAYTQMFINQLYQ